MKQKQVYIALIFIYFNIANTIAQEYFSLYNLEDYVIQAQNNSPVYIPKNTFTFAVPIANLSLNFNSGFKVNELLVKNEQTDKLEYNLNNLYKTSEDTNDLNLDVTINLFNIAFKRNRGSFTVFANTKTTNNWRYTKDFLKIAANGINEDFVLREQNEYSGYNEFGVGFTQTFLDDKLAVALRVKYLNGYVHSSTEDDLLVAFDLDEQSGSYNITAKNATVNNAGSIFNESSGEFKLFTDNTGLAFDFGATYKLTNKLTFEVAINDVGSIHWKEDVTNFNLKDTGENGVLFNGLNLENYYNSTNNIRNDVLNLISSTINATETSKSFTTNLNIKTYLSTKYAITEENTVRLVIFNTLAFNDFNPSFSLGYNRTLHKTTFGLLASKNYNNEFLFGANFSINLGPIQFYGATDSLRAIFTKPEEARGANASIGLNFFFDYIRKDNNNYFFPE